MEQTSYVYDSRKRVNKTSWYLASPAAFIYLAVRLCAVHTVLVLGWHLFWPLNFMLPPSLSSLPTSLTLASPPPVVPQHVGLIFCDLGFSKAWLSLFWLGRVQAFPFCFVQGSFCDCKIIVWWQCEWNFTCGQCGQFCFFFKYEKGKKIPPGPTSAWGE